MQVFTSLKAFLDFRKDDLAKTGFVPTMGALHAGHLNLVRQALEENEQVIVSIFVNPAQFGPNEDFDKYPRTPENDLEKLKDLGKVIVLMPSKEEVYFEQPYFSISCGSLGTVLCGKTRPDHFNGVCLIVNKLFNLIGPCNAYFGRKDFQQTVILYRMVKELNLPVNLIVCPTVREADGLALSSRNVYLNQEERKQAIGLFETMKLMKSSVSTGNPVPELVKTGKEYFKGFPILKLDYLEIVNKEDLSTPELIFSENNPVVAIAAYCGATRLIDNIDLFG
jgi:pantoate--beta-alanine ligase